MGYVSKYNRTFINFMNNKYKRYKVCFKNWDEYAIWLYYFLTKKNDKLYYHILEKDIWEYSDFQTGSAREQEKKDKNWRSLEQDRFKLFTNNEYEDLMQELERRATNEKKTW